MENILIIGNGFDITHGLKTCYLDFVLFTLVLRKCLHIYFYDKVERLIECKNREILLYNSLHELLVDDENKQKENEEEKMKYLIENLNNYLNNSEVNKNEKVDFIESCLKNYWIDHVVENQKVLGKNWADFEGAIKKQVSALIYILDHGYDIYSNDFSIDIRKEREVIKLLSYIKKESMKEDFDNIKLEMLNGLKELKFILEIYMAEIVNTNVSEQKNFKCLSSEMITHVLSFNYTKTCERIYKYPESNIHYIHGFARNLFERQSFENNIILGIGKDIKESNDIDNIDFLDFQKFYQRIINCTGNTYKSWKSNNPMNVFIYGHSLDPNDGDIIKEFADCKNSKIVIFYYDQDSFRDIVSNLVETFTVDKMIEYTSTDKISFKRINKEEDYISPFIKKTSV